MFPATAHTDRGSGASPMVVPIIVTGEIQSVVIDMDVLVVRPVGEVRGFVVVENDYVLS
jgi:hypothetical protein